MEKLDIYKITIDEEYSDGNDLGIEQIAFVTSPAIKVKGFAFNSQEKLFTFKDDIKMRIAAPALIPMNIYRNDSFGEYYVQFTKEEIEKIFVKFMSNLDNTGKFNLEHDPSKTVPAFVLETWLVGKDNKADRSYSEFGIELPEGSLFIVSQITNKEYYDNLVKNNQVGFSVEGFLGLKLSEIQKEYKFESYNDYPKAATENAKRALKYKEENGSRCGTPVGWARARQLANGELISVETIQRMANFIRHKQNSKTPYNEGCGGIMWDAWGGDEGIEWAIRKIEQLKKEKEFKINLSDMNKITLPDGEWPINGKTYIVENGEIVEVIDQEEMVEDVTKSTECNCEGKKFEEVLEPEVETETEIVTIDESKILEVIQPKLDEIYKVIADLKIAIDSKVDKVEDKKVEEMQMSVHEKFSAISNFLNKK